MTSKNLKPSAAKSTNAKVKPASKPLYEIIEITSELQKKTKMVASLEILQKQLESDGEKALAKLEDNFDEWMNDNYLPLKNITSEIKNNGLTQERLDILYICLHELKGISHTLGYSLVGDLAYCLCNAIEIIEDYKLIPISIIEQFTISIQVIISNKVKNDGTTIARTLVKRLTDVTNEYVAETERKRASLKS